MTGTAITDTGIANGAATLETIMRSRHAVRAFTQAPVPRAEVEHLLAQAATAPSNSNTQPWRVHVLAGPAKAALSVRLLAAFDSGNAPAPTHFPDPLPPAPAAWQRDFGERYYKALRIDREDMAARSRQSRRNLEFFGAPVGLIFSIDARLQPYSWVDLGMFLQNLLLAAHARGLGACPQVSFARFHHIIAAALDMPEGQRTVCGMSLGHPDPQAEVNRIDFPRAPVSDFARFLDC